MNRDFHRASIFSMLKKKDIRVGCIVAIEEEEEKGGCRPLLIPSHAIWAR